MTGDSLGDLRQSLDLLRMVKRRKYVSLKPFLKQFQLLSEACYEPAFEFFVGVLDDSRAAWRVQALSALWGYGRRFDTRILNKVRLLLLNDDSEDVRFWAVGFLGCFDVWEEPALVASLKSESSAFVRESVFKAILRLRGVSDERAEEAYQMVKAGWFQADWGQVQRIVTEWKATNPRVVYPEFQGFHTDLVKGKALSARGVELLKASASGYQGLSDYLEFVGEVGLCSVGRGFLWLVDPADFEVEVKMMFGNQDLTGQDLTGQDLTGQDLTGQDMAVFARTSFGGLFVVTRESIFWISPFHGDYDPWKDYDFELFFEVLSQPVTLEENMNLSSHQQAVEALGVLEVHECYGVQPRVEHYGIEVEERLEIHGYLRFLLGLKPMRRKAEALN